MDFIDLHIHTNASDGTDSPARVVEKARELGLAAIAITDHDTIAGVEEAQARGRELGVEVVSGVELAVEVQLRERFDIVNKLLDTEGVHNATLIACQTEAGN